MTLPEPEALALSTRDLHKTVIKRGRKAIDSVNGDIPAAASLYLHSMESAGLISGEDRRQIEKLAVLVFSTSDKAWNDLVQAEGIYEDMLSSGAQPVAVTLAGGVVNSLELTAEGAVASGPATADFIGGLGGGSLGGEIGAAGGPWGAALGAVVGGTIGLAAASITAALDD